VNRPQIDIKRKICDIRTWEKHLFLDISSTNIDKLGPSLYKCVETRSIEVLWLLSQQLPHLRFNLFVISETFATFLDQSSQPLYETYTSRISLWISFCLEETHNRTLLFGSTPLKHGRHCDYWNQPQNMRMRIWYLEYHETGLRCYLVIHIEKLLRPLQLFYFHLWSNYITAV
jgi:hypothetical protein